MLKLEIDVRNDSGDLAVDLHGDVNTLAAETSILLNKIYLGIKETSQMAAEVYRAFVTRCVTDPNSPTWSGEEDAEV